LLDYIETLEECLGKKAVKEFLPMQPGDVLNTFCDVSDLEREFNYRPSTVTIPVNPVLDIDKKTCKNPCGFSESLQLVQRFVGDL